MTNPQTVLTVTDMFCGAGGSSQGAVAAGAEVRMAANHWELAIRTHNTNFPETDHDLADINQVNPRRWPTTTMLWASPECTNHSIGKGKRRWNGQLNMFEPHVPDPEAERSRATMWDVPRFAEFHNYRSIIVENVVDARKWVLFDAWLHAMQLLGYHYQILYLNSMFFGTPQSRDRMYVVFWKKGLPAPDLDFRPWAICPQCEMNVQAIQSWKKPDFPWGRYGEREQYLYRCPDCGNVTAPYVTPSLVALDLMDPGQRIGDRPDPLKPRTMGRLQAGLDRYGDQYLLVDLAHTHSKNIHTKPISLPMMTQTTAQTIGYVAPFVLDTAYDGEGRIRGVTEPTMTQTGRQSQAVAMPFLTSVNYFDDQNRPVTGPMPTQTTANKQALTIPPAAVIVFRRLDHADSLSEPLSTITAGGINHGLLQMPFFIGYANGDSPPRPATEPLHTIHTENGQAVIMPFVLNMRGWSDSYLRANGASEPLHTITTSPPFGLVTPALPTGMKVPFLTSYYGKGGNRAVSEPMGTIPTIEKHALVRPEALRVEDCFFRMLKDHEIGRGMAFRDNYVVLGNSRQKVKQYGNAVTPPVSEWLFARVTRSFE